MRADRSLPSQSGLMIRSSVTGRTRLFLSLLHIPSFFFSPVPLVLPFFLSLSFTRLQSTPVNLSFPRLHPSTLQNKVSQCGEALPSLSPQSSPTFFSAPPFTFISIARLVHLFYDRLKIFSRMTVFFIHLA